MLLSGGIHIGMNKVLVVREGGDPPPQPSFSVYDILFSILYTQMSGFDFGELVKRAIKYIIEGLVVAIAAYAIPKHNKLNTEEIVIIALTAAATFSILDVFIPSMGASVRQGAGLGVGFNLVKFPVA